MKSNPISTSLAARLVVTFALAMMSPGCKWLGSTSPLFPLERSIVYQPTKCPVDFELPADSPIKEVQFSAADQTRLHGLYIAHADPRGVAIFCYGNAGNVTDRIQSLANLSRQHRLNVMMFDYRGYGRSEGKPSERGILQDARAARKWIAQENGIEETEVIVMGRSLGGGVAIDLASKDGAKALVVASTFPSLPKVASHHLRYLPANLMMTQRLDSISKVENYHGPFLQTHGVDDQLIPMKMAKELFDSVGSDRKFFVKVPGGHNAPQTIEYREAFDDLLDSLDKVN